MTRKTKPFWETKSLDQMTLEEWESLCDGCGQCCLHKIIDNDSDDVLYTYVACRLLDLETCRCTSYKQRLKLIADCIKIEPRKFSRMHLLPESCAYRRLSERRKLEPWHPLISNDPKSVHHADISVRDKAVSEKNIHRTQFYRFLINKEDSR